MFLIFVCLVSFSSTFYFRCFLLWVCFFFLVAMVVSFLFFVVGMFGYWCVVVYGVCWCGFGLVCVLSPLCFFVLVFLWGLVVGGGVFCLFAWLPLGPGLLACVVYVGWFLLSLYAPLLWRFISFDLFLWQSLCSLLGVFFLLVLSL